MSAYFAPAPREEFRTSVNLKRGNEDGEWFVGVFE